MDLTADFRRLAGLGRERLPPPVPLPRPEGGFLHAAAAVDLALAEIRCALQLDAKQAAGIRALEAKMAELEALIGDTSDLGAEVPPPPRDRDLLAHRRGTVSGLYGELRELASRVQASQVDELQRQAEVAGFFSAQAPSAARRRPPPAPAFLPPEAASLPAVGAASAVALRQEEMALLTTFESDLDKMQETQAKIEEIANLVGIFATKIEEQQEQVEHIHHEAEEATQYIEDAEKHLHRAVQNSTSYRFYVVCWFLGSASALLVFDFIDARYSWI